MQVTLEWLQARGQFQKYKYFIFLNSSVKGPFFPSYMPAGWQWTDAFIERLEGDVRGVSSSLVCLPHEDAGGYGAKMESWAFALDTQGGNSLVAMHLDIEVSGLGFCRLDFPALYWQQTWQTFRIYFPAPPSALHCRIGL